MHEPNTSPWEAAGRRRSHPLNQPLPVTLRWASNFPDELRPRCLLSQFPRIANMLARAWHNEHEREDYLDSLLVDRRAHRRGFPPEVQNELLMLRDIATARAGQSATEAPGPDRLTAAG